MEKCNSCEQMKRENASVRKAITETNKNFVEVINENLKLKRKLDDNGVYYHGDLNQPNSKETK